MDTNFSGMFKHDCKNCVYQFSIINDNIPSDIYICNNGGVKTLILRLGNKPDCNLSYEWNDFQKSKNVRLVTIRKMLEIKEQCNL